MDYDRIGFFCEAKTKQLTNERLESVKVVQAQMLPVLVINSVHCTEHSYKHLH